MGLIETIASIFGHRTKREIEHDRDFKKAIEKQTNGVSELASARAKLEACRSRIHARTAKIEAAAKEATRDRQESAHSNT